MSQELNLNQEEKEALDSIESELGARRTRLPGRTDAIEDLCGTYRTLRPTLEILLKIVRKIPGIGGKIAKVIEFLMGIADIACPVQ